MLISQGGLRSRPIYRLALQILLWASCPHLYLMSIWPLLLLTTPLWLTTLAVVLEALSKAPFEPLEEVPLRFITVKTVFLLAISSLKRVGDLEALSVAPSCLAFVPRMVRAFLYPWPGYVPKVPSVIPRPVVLQEFCPHPFRDVDQEKLNCTVCVFLCTIFTPLTFVRFYILDLEALQFSLPKLCHSTLGRTFVSMVAWAVSFPKCLPT